MNCTAVPQETRMPQLKLQQHLPVIDLAASFGHDPQQRLDTAAQVDAACREHGFFQVRGHGVPLALLSHLFMLSRRLFQLPERVKQQWHIEQSEHPGLQRGYDPIGWQSLEVGRPADLEESFYLGVDRGPNDPLVRAGIPGQGPNQWPDEALVPGFQATSEAFAASMQRLARHLMGLVALGLKLPRTHFEPCMRDPMPVLRLLHYPPQPARPEPGQIGCGAHTDWGALTLLAQDKTGGLQVQDRSGQWQDVAPLEGALVVNLGDLMARWTNERYRSTLHRVVHADSSRDRYSMAYFFEIDHDTVVSPLPGCHSADNPPRHAPITAGEHVREMYRRTTLGAGLGTRQDMATMAAATAAQAAGSRPQAAEPAGPPQGRIPQCAARRYPSQPRR
jgi:isopenicillin N synthase-like dioxygenase